MYYRPYTTYVSTKNRSKVNDVYNSWGEWKCMMKGKESMVRFDISIRTWV